MKRCMIITLCILMLCGCSSAPEYQKPVEFYYLASETSYTCDSSAIVSELREGSDMGTLEETMSAYLAGPSDPELITPFPDGLRLVRIYQDQNTVYITVSQEISDLTNLDLTFACTCIALTCLDITNAVQVCIDAENGLLDGQKNVILDKESLQLTDYLAKGE